MISFCWRHDGNASTRDDSGDVSFILIRQIVCRVNLRRCIIKIHGIELRVRVWSLIRRVDKDIS